MSDTGKAQSKRRTFIGGLLALAAGHAPAAEVVV
jgi:hypothetical protein